MPSFKMKFSGVTVLQGVEFSIFHIDFEWALQQCSSTALPVIRSKGIHYSIDAAVHTIKPLSYIIIIVSYALH